MVGTRGSRPAPQVASNQASPGPSDLAATPRVAPTDWKKFAHNNPQGAVLWFLKEHRVRGGIPATWTAQELADELGLRVGVVREQLNIWLGAGRVECLSGVLSRSGARLWRAKT